MKDLKLYSFFFCFVLVFYSFPACCVGESFVDFFFGPDDVSHSSFTSKLPQISRSDEKKTNSNTDEYINISLHVVVAFQHATKVVYFPVVVESFNMTHINTKTKLPKFTKRIKEAFPSGMYGLEVENFENIDVVMNGVYMKPEDNIEALIEKSRIETSDPVPIMLIVHPTSDWVQGFFLKELNADFEKAKSEYNDERKQLIDEVNNFFSSLNLSQLKLYKVDEVCNKNIDFVCSKGEEKFQNKYVQVLIQTECKGWKHRLANAKHKLNSKQQYLDLIKKNNLRKK